MLLAKVALAGLWAVSTLWSFGEPVLYRNPLETRRVANARYTGFAGHCYDARTGIVGKPNGRAKHFKHRCMRATCFRNYTMLVESCLKSTCYIPNIKYSSVYPHCCPEVICKKGHRLRYLLTNETVASFPTRRPQPTKRRRKQRQRKNGKGSRKGDGEEAHRTGPGNGTWHSFTSSTRDSVPELVGDD